MPVKTKSPARGGKSNLVQRFNALSLVKKPPRSSARVAVASPERSESEATILALRRARPRTSPARPYRRPTAATPGADADAALARRLAAENAPPAPSEADDLRVAQQLRIQLDEERRQQEARDEAFARSLAQQGPSAPPNPF